MNKAVTMPDWINANKPPLDALHESAWLAEWRQVHWEAFLQNGLPVRRQERWKYTDMSVLTKQQFVRPKQIDPTQLQDAIQQHRLRLGQATLLVLVNGYFMPTLSDMDKLPSDVVVCRLSDAIQQYERQIKAHWPSPVDTQKYPFASLNAAMWQDGLFFFLPDHCELTTPIHLLSLTVNETASAAYQQHHIVLGKQSKLNLFEEHFSLVEQAYMNNIVTHVTVGPQAHFEYYKVQQEGKQAVHMSHAFVTQWQESIVNLTSFSFGGAFARDDVVIKLQGVGATCCTNGFYQLQQVDQYVDHHVDVDHVAPHSKSEMFYKGILDNKARAVFNGRLHVMQQAQKIVAYQANHNLLLSDQAEIYAKPELEIYADDVQCRHGATTGQLDQDALFYMLARGIEKEEAMRILLRGFADEVLQRVKEPGIKLRVMEMLS